MNLENQKLAETNVKQYYEILRSRQTQIIGIIKETSELLSRINTSKYPNGAGNSNRFAEQDLGNGVQLAFGMINALANILDEQMKALNIWERLLLEEKEPVDLKNDMDFNVHDYYDITNN